MANGIFYTMGLKNGSFLRGMLQSSGAVSSFAGKVTRMAAAAAAAAAPLIGVASAAGILKKSIAEAANFEQTSVAFRVLIGDAKAAEQTLRDLTDFAASTPFQFDGIASAARQLIASGAGGKQLISNLTAIGNAAAGTTRPIEQLATIYAKAMNLGKLNGEIIKQFAEAGIPIWDALVKVTGRTHDEIGKLASQGKLGTDVLRQAFQDLSAEGGKYFQLMQLQSATTAGLFSTLKDNVVLLFREFGTPINNALKPILTDAIGLVQDLQPKIAAIGESVGKALSIVFQSIKEGKFVELLGLGLTVAAKTFGNNLLNGAEAVVAFVRETLGSIKGSFFDSSLMTGFTAIATVMALRWISAVSAFLGQRQKSETARNAADQIQENIPGWFDKARENMGKDIAAGLAKGIEAGKDAATEVARNPKDRFDLTGTRTRFDQLAADLLSNVPTPDDLDPGADKSPDGFLAPLVDSQDKLVRALDKAAVAIGAKDAPDPVADSPRSRRRGILSAAESFHARQARMSEADREKNPLPTRGPMDRRALEGAIRSAQRAEAMAAKNAPARDRAPDPEARDQVNLLRMANDKLLAIVNAQENLAVAN